MTLIVQDLHFLAGQEPLLSAINLSITEAKLIAIVGPNGAGKSTLLHCMAGLHSDIDAIKYHGQPLRNINEKTLSQWRAVLPQSNNLDFPFMVKDVISMSFALQTISQDTQKLIAHRCMERASVLNLSQRNYLSLSGGEKKRVHLARVMAQIEATNDSEKLQFLFLDEPAAPLDLKHQFKLFKQLQELTSQLNVAVVVVVHDLDLAAAFADEIWVLNQGHLVASGSASQVINETLLKDHFDIRLSIINHQSIPQLNKLSYQ